MKSMLQLQDIDFTSELIPVAVQNGESGQVLMLAYANSEAVAATLESGYAHFWSRSRKKLWKRAKVPEMCLKSGAFWSIVIQTRCFTRWIRRVRPAIRVKKAAFTGSFREGKSDPVR
jgi:phosphoribosyl-AMP cyclohydrolase